MACKGIDVRARAADLVIRCAGNDPDIARLVSLVVFFECYLLLGIDETEKQMHLLQPRKVGKLKVIAGRKLEGVLTNGKQP